MPTPKKYGKLSLHERIRRARRRVALQRKKCNYPDEWAMHEQIGNAYLSYGAPLNMEQLVFMGDMLEMMNQEKPLAPADIGKLRTLWDHFVRPLLEGDAS